jgi:hypothetical protein
VQIREFPEFAIGVFRKDSGNVPVFARPKHCKIKTSAETVQFLQIILRRKLRCRIDLKRMNVRRSDKSSY